MAPRLLATLFAVFAALGIAAGPAIAESAAIADGLVIDGTSVDATEAGDDYTAKIALFNTGPSTVTLPEVVKITDTCSAKVGDRAVGGLRSAEVTLTFDAACFGVASSLQADLDAGGPLPAVTIKKPEDGHDWRPMKLSALASLVAAIVVGLIGIGMVKSIDKKRKNPSDPNGERQQAYVRFKDLVNARITQLSLGGPLAWKPALPEPPGEYGLRSEVKGLEAGWSFKDSWAANLTVATTALVALLNSADTLKALLGEEPKAALGVMTVAGLVSAVVIAVANTVAKLVGETTSQVTTGGLVLSTSLVVFAAGLQAGTVGGTALTLVDGFAAHAVVVVLLVAVGGVLLWYAPASMYSTLKAGAPADPLPVVPADAFEAWAATDDWEKAVVRDRIETTYSRWLQTPAPSAAVTPYPVPRMGWTSLGDEYLRPRASLI